ncbi:MAG: 4-hydroxythreonine-4-phosphate dehydrogenase PdxA [Saprospiraceae bacterium]|nr:4-hydroxythreonine-4-phosphate dehydrogenase PdxA [Saprospiraceae bacterium]
MDKLKIGISIGDINGIGLEVILKALSHNKIVDRCTAIVYGSSKVVSYHKNIVGVDFHFQSINKIGQANPNKVNILNCWQDSVNITLGKPSKESGQYAWQSLESAVNDLQEKKIDALVTAPISKEAMHMAEFPHPGHTEYLTHKMGSRESLMFMINDDLRIGVATNHIPLKEVVSTLSKELIVKKIRLMHNCLKMDFGIERPTIAVLGVNPHASDNGVFGKEEEELIRPAVVECKKKGIMVMGPFPADGFFGSSQFSKFDGILAMYHDQGLVPFKLLSFGKGVNYTAGLPAVRTSPDHGTAFELAGKNMADPSSFLQALFQAMDIAQSRRDHEEMHANALVKRKKEAEDVLAGQEEIPDETNKES